MKEDMPKCINRVGKQMECIGCQEFFAVDGGSNFYRKSIFKLVSARRLRLQTSGIVVRNLFADRQAKQVR